MVAACGSANGLIDGLLQINEPSKKAKVVSIVDEQLRGLNQDGIDAEVSALAQSTSEQDLEAELTFAKTSSAMNLEGAKRDVAAQLIAVIQTGAALAAAPEPSDQKLALINRVLAAEGLEARSRRQFRATPEPVLLRLHISLGDHTPKSLRAAEDDYVKLLHELAVQAYSARLTEEQLGNVVDFFEGPAGRDLAARRSRMAGLISIMTAEAIKHRYSTIQDEACSAMACSAIQRVKLSKSFEELTSAIDKYASQMSDGIGSS